MDSIGVAYTGNTFSWNRLTSFWSILTRKFHHKISRESKLYALKFFLVLCYKQKLVAKNCYFLSEATWKDISSASTRLNWKEKENSRTDSVCLALNMYFIAKAVPFHVAENLDKFELKSSIWHFLNSIFCTR